MNELGEKIRAIELFEGNQPIFVARAPGRLDVMGGVADYSGSLVLQMPIRAAAVAAVQTTDTGEVLAVSGARRAALPVSALTSRSLGELSHLLAGDGGWAAYVLGPIAVLVQDERVELPGLKVLIASEVPEGKGVSSSAAVEVAAIHAAAACLGRRPDSRRLALLAQTAENKVARAPCGVMDQLTAACGRANRLLSILCRPAEIQGSIPVEESLALWGIDSGVRHAVAGRQYRHVRCATFMGRQALGLDDHTYLTELGPSEVQIDRLPEQIAGREFLARYGPVGDPISVVDADGDYPVRAAAMHAIDEHQRVRMFAELLSEPMTDRRAHLLGELMYQSHAGYSRLGLGTPTTDEIVERVRAVGWREGLVGARLSGGGSGGTVAVFGRQEAEPLVRAISDELGAGVIYCSSDGAERFGVQTLEKP